MPQGPPQAGSETSPCPAPVERSSRSGRLPLSPVQSVRLTIREKKKAASPISTKVIVVVTREEYKVFIVGKNGGFGESYYTESFGIGNPVAF